MTFLEFVPLAKASAEAQIGVPSYDFWPSLAAASNSKLTSLHRLSEAVREERALASTFVCGGQISAPVALYWDTPTYHHGSASKIVFPLLRTARDVDKTNDLDQLVARLASDAQPATFGRGKEDVLDESYRRAKKLDREQFTTSFHPADHGILDDIAQMLLPTMLIGRGAGEGELEKRGVRAELWKLNVSTAFTYQDSTQKMIFLLGLFCLTLKNSASYRYLTLPADLLRSSRQVSLSCRHTSVCRPVRFIGCLSALSS